MTKEEKREYKKTWYIINKERLNKKNKIYRENNRDHINKIKKLRYDCNKEELNKIAKIYYKNNKEKINTQNNIYKRNKLKTNYLFKLTCTIRTTITGAFTRNGYTKKSKSYQILGCTFEEFKLHLESKFETWMTWVNYGLYNGELNYGWDIDHIIPLATAKSEEDIIRLNHYSNLQPLCSKTNRDIKRNII